MLLEVFNESENKARSPDDFSFSFESIHSLLPTDSSASVSGHSVEMDEMNSKFLEDWMTKAERRKMSRRVDVPRILRRDIRLLYSTMFTNVFNITDYHLFRGFFNEYCRPDLLVKFDSSANTEQIVKVRPNMPRTASLVSSSLAADFVYLASQFTPDATMHIKDTVIRQQKYSENCKIEFTLKIEGTRIQETMHWSDCIYSREDVTTTSMTPEDSSDNGNKRRCLPLIECETHAGRRGYVRLYTAEECRLLLSTSPMLEKPQKMAFEAKLVMHVNAEKQITCLELTSVFSKNEFENI
jgi:hypothetical protein